MAEYLSDGSRQNVAGVRPGAVLVVAGDDAATTVGELWPTMSADSTTAVIERLTARGLGNTPDFALVTWTRTPPARCACWCGATSRSRIGATRISGVDVSTWTERLVDAPTEFEIAALGADVAAEWFPMVDGVVAAGRVAVPARSTSLRSGRFAPWNRRRPRRARARPRRPRRTPCRFR